MEDFNLLEHSTYNVEKIKRNREFFNMLMGKIKSAYQVFNYREYDSNNKKRVSFAPSDNRIDNVFIGMDTNGEIQFQFNVSRLNKTADISHYKVHEYSFHTELTINGVNADNYREHLPHIVKGIEFCDYSFR